MQGPMAETVEALVVGAGVVGLAIARALARSGREVVVLEQERSFGTGASSRNSEVIHAGIYYRPGSLKARTCLEGKRRLYAYCKEHGVPHRRLGKLVVADDPEGLAVLERLHHNARACGVDDLERLDRAGVLALEPELSVQAGLLSPSTGIIDSHELMRAFLSDAEQAGAMVAWDTPVRAGRTSPRLGVSTDDADVECELLVNAAGLGAQALARGLRGFDPASVPPLHLCKGSYFTLAGPHPFRHLVYPTPATASLGIHLTLDMAGQARFGPDQQWVSKLDYEVDPDRAPDFYGAIRRYWPGLPDGSLQPGYAGIRAKLERPGGSGTDFMIQGPSEHGIEGLVHLFGIESPGLTASLALADHVLRRLGIEPPEG